MSVSGREDRSIADQLAALSASIVADATGGKGVVEPGLIRFSGTGTIAGRAMTAACSEGSLQAIFAALEHAEAGAVLCVSGPGNSAYLGDLLASDLAKRGLAGAVIDGLIRDRATIATMPVSFFARGLTPMALRRPEPGSPMVPISIGGVTIHPGDWIVADDDGVVVIVPQDVDGVIAKAAENAQIEVRIMELVEAGAKITEAVRQALAEARAEGA
jgi:regulator of RNase E activity RraA